MIRRRDDHGVDVLVVEHAAHVLHEAGLERRDVAEPRVVDALAARFASTSHSVLTSTFASRAKPRLSELPWPRMPMLATTTRSLAPMTRLPTCGVAPSRAPASYRRRPRPQSPRQRVLKSRRVILLVLRPQCLLVTAVVARASSRGLSQSVPCRGHVRAAVTSVLGVDAATGVVLRHAQETLHAAISSAWPPRPPPWARLRPQLARRARPAASGRSAAG